MTYEPEFVATMNHEILKVNPEAGQNEIDTAFIREFALLNEHGNEDTPERLMQLLELMHAWLAATPKERRDNRMLAAQGQLAVSQEAARKASLREQAQHSALAAVRDKLDASAEAQSELIRWASDIMDYYETRFTASQKHFISENKLLRKQHTDLTAKLEQKAAECRLLSEKAAKAELTLAEQRTIGLATAKELKHRAELISKLSAALVKT